MQLRDYLHVALRNKWLIVLCTVAVAALSVAAQARRPPVYRSTADVLLLPNNPAERLTPAENVYFDPDRHAAVQASVMSSRPVLAEAARQLGGDATPGRIARKVSVATSDESDILMVTASDRSPQRASDIANTVARTYIEDRRKASVSSLQQAVDQITPRLEELERNLAQLAELSAAQAARRAGGAETSVSADIQAMGTQYQGLFARQQDLLIEMSLRRGEAELIGPAQVPDEPSGTSMPTALALGALLGAMIGLGLAFLREQLDDRVRSHDEVEKLTGLPVLAELRVDRSMRKPSRLATVDEPLGSVAEATRTLRTSINFLGIDQPIRRVLVTSASPGDGKTAVAANLAAAFAQAGHSTVLVSADLRRPRLEELFEVPSDASGLTDVLALGASQFGRHEVGRHEVGGEGGGSYSLSGDARQTGTGTDLRGALIDRLVPTRVPDLSLLPAGAQAPNPAELLSSAQMDRVLDELSTIADIVIIDTSPLLAVADASALAQKAGHVLLVASLSSTRRRALARAIAAVRSSRAQLLGVVMNRTRAKDGPGAYYGRPQAGPATGRFVPQKLRPSTPDRSNQDSHPMATVTTTATATTTAMDAPATGSTTTGPTTTGPTTTEPTTTEASANGTTANGTTANGTTANGSRARR